jgi:deaminated glutathione amidase
LAQILSTEDPAANLDQVEQETAAAARAGADLVVFPEATMRCFGRSLTEVAEPLDGPWATRVREVAARHRLVVVAGMFSPAPDGRVTNVLLATGPGVEAAYAKIHLYDAFGFTESATVAPGDHTVLIDVAGERVGLSTCYDIRFPELYVGLAQQGATVVVVAASWGAGPGKLDQWRLLARARALDATVHVLAAGQADPSTAGRARGAAPTGVGHSLGVGPDGGVRGELGPETGRLLLDVSAEDVASVRRTLPVLANRRLGPALTQPRPLRD